MTSIGNVMTPDSGDLKGVLTFTLSLRNAGTLPYDCGALKALARTERGTTAIVGPLTGESGVPCAGPDDALAPGHDVTFAFVISLMGGTPQEVVALPFGSYASKVVWSVSGA